MMLDELELIGDLILCLGILIGGATMVYAAGRIPPKD